MRQAQGRPLLSYVIERVRCVEMPMPVCVATSDAASDDLIADFCASEGVDCYRGDLANVAQRLLMAAQSYAADGFVRISGDSPLIDPALIDRAVRLFYQEQADLVSNVLVRSFPKGQSVEIIACAALARALICMEEAADREHVTRFFYKNPDDFRIFGFSHRLSLEEMQLSVDTLADFKKLESILSKFSHPHWHYDLEAIIHIMHELEAI